MFEVIMSFIRSDYHSPTAETMTTLRQIFWILSTRPHVFAL